MPVPDNMADDIELDDTESNDHGDHQDTCRFGTPGDAVSVEFTFRRTELEADIQRPVRVLYADLEAHEGEQVLVDLRRRRRNLDGTEQRVDPGDIDDRFERSRYEQELKRWGCEIVGTLEAATVSLQSNPPAIDTEFRDDHPDAEFVVHTNGVINKRNDPSCGTAVGEQGFSRVKGGNGMYHLVETADVFLQWD